VEGVVVARAVKGEAVKEKAIRVRVVHLPLRPLPLQLMHLLNPPLHETSRPTMRCSLHVSLRAERAVVARAVNTDIIKVIRERVVRVRVRVALPPPMPPLLQLKHHLPKPPPQGISLMLMR
jgi:hypothetical protein